MNMAEKPLSEVADFLVIFVPEVTLPESVQKRFTRRSVQYDMNRLLWLQVLAYSFNPVKSIPTTGSFPTAHALCPGGITAASPGPNFFFAVVHYHLNSTRNNVLSMRRLAAICFHNGFDTFFPAPAWLKYNSTNCNVTRICQLNFTIFECSCFIR